MIKIDDQKCNRLIAKKSACNIFNTCLLTALIVLAVVSAVLGRGAESGGESLTAFVAVISLFGALLLIFASVNLFYVIKVNRGLKSAIARSIAEEMTRNHALLTGGSEVKLRVTYENECMTVERVNALREMKVGKAGFSASGSKAQFDLKDLRRLQSVFTRFGEWILQFIEAYYGVNCNFTAVSVLDETGKSVEEIPVIKDGNLIYGSKNNYFIKNGIVK